MINHNLPQYTITIDYIIRGLLNADFEHTLTDAEIKEALPLIFDFDYGIDTQYKMFFEYSFIRHYLYREIAVTPLERWKQYLQEFCFANYMHIESICKSAQKEIEPLISFNYTEDGASKRKLNETSDSTGTNERTGDSTEVNSAFPQATLNEMDYASGSTQVQTSDTGKNTMQAKRDTEDDYTNHIERKGNQGLSVSELLKSFYLNGFPLMSALYKSANYLFFSVY